MFHQVSTFLAQLVPCSGTDCTTEDLQVLVINVIQGLIDIAALIAVVSLIWGGLLMLTSGGSEDRISKGRKAITAAVIGIVIVLVAIVAINTFIDKFTNCTGSWTNFNLICG